MRGGSAATTARTQNAVESMQSAAEAIGEITPGMGLFILTRGQWSFVDAVHHILEQAGPAELSIWTWTVAPFDMAQLRLLTDRGLITSARLFVDRGGRGAIRLITDWQELYGEDSARWVISHAKMARFRCSSGLRLLLRGSPNLNYNPRFENFDLSEGDDAYRLVEQVEAAEFPVIKPEDGAAVYRASKISDRFTAESFLTFEELPPWQP